MLRLCLEHNGARAVAKKNAGRAIRPIENARERFGTDDERSVRLSGLQEIIRNRQCIDEPRAHRLDIESGALRDAEHLLDFHRRRREGAIGRRGRANDEIDVDRIDPCTNQCLLRRGRAEIGRQLGFVSDMPTDYAGAFLDPGVGGVDYFREIMVGYDAFRKMRADAADHRAENCQVYAFPRELPAAPRGCELAAAGESLW